MSIHFISGKPGGGKSFYGLKLIVEELADGHREIFTNVPINPGALAEYLAARYPERDLRVGERLRILSDDEVSEFWTYRPGAVRIPRLTAPQWAAGGRPDYSGVSSADRGVMYVIDEVHNYFGARQWAETGRDVLFYLSQHRKLSDTVICITQAVNNVDKQFRSVTQDFTYLRNLSKESYGKFRLPGVFVRKTFSSPPSDTSTPMESGTFRLDITGLAACYDSAQGVGIHGRGADKSEKRRGLPWFYFVGGFVGIVVLAFLFLPRLIAAEFTSPMRHQLVQASKSSPAAAPVVGSVQGRVVHPVGVVPLSVQSVPAGSAPTGTNVWVTAYVVWPGAILIGLSDGRVYHWPRDKAVSYVGDDFVCIGGEVYPQKKR